MKNSMKQIIISTFLILSLIATSIMSSTAVTSYNPLGNVHASAEDYTVGTKSPVTCDLKGQLKVDSSWANEQNKVQIIEQLNKEGVYPATTGLSDDAKFTKALAEGPCVLTIKNTIAPATKIYEYTQSTTGSRYCYVEATSWSAALPMCESGKPTTGKMVSPLSPTPCPAGKTTDSYKIVVKGTAFTGVGAYDVSQCTTPAVECTANQITVIENGVKVCKEQTNCPAGTYKDNNGTCIQAPQCATGYEAIRNGNTITCVCPSNTEVFNNNCVTKCDSANGYIRNSAGVCEKPVTPTPQTPTPTTTTAKKSNIWKYALGAAVVAGGACIFKFLICRKTSTTPTPPSTTPPSTTTRYCLFPMNGGSVAMRDWLKSKGNKVTPEEYKAKATELGLRAIVSGSSCRITSTTPTPTPPTTPSTQYCVNPQNGGSVAMRDYLRSKNYKVTPAEYRTKALALKLSPTTSGSVCSVSAPITPRG